MATRMGSKESGISGHIRGWHVGARVNVSYSADTGKDVVSIYRTDGSSGGSAGETLVAEFTG
jgi:hypothetical protein